MYEKLLTYQYGTSTIIPSLATSLPKVSSDGLTWTFDLRPNVQFHDGTMLDSNAVMVSMNRALNVGSNGPIAFFGLNKMNLIDDMTISFVFDTAYPGRMDSFATGLGLLILSPTAMTNNATSSDPWATNWFLDNEAGTGPYMLNQFVENTSVSYKAFPNYWQGWSGNHVQNIVGVYVEDEGTRKLDLLSGELDLAESLSITDSTAVGNAAGYSSAYQDTIGPGYFILQKKPGSPLADINLRRALTYAFDYDSMITQVLNNHWVQQQGPISYACIGHNNSLPLYKQNLPLATQFLSDAGYKPGELTLTLQYNVYGFKQQIAQLFQSNLASIGVTLNIDVVEFPVMFANMTTPDSTYDVYMYWAAANVNEPVASFLEPLLASWAIDPNLGMYNHYYSNPQVDALISKALTETDPTAYVNEIMQIQALAVADVESIYLCDWPVPESWSNSVQNMKLSPLIYGEYDYYQVYKS